VFEQDHSESPAVPEKKVSTVVLLAAGGVLVATVCATLASMLAGGAGRSEAGPPKAKAEVEADQPASTSTSVSVAPDGSTATVLITVPGKVRPDERAQNVAGPVESSVSPVVVVTEASVVETTRRPTSSSVAPTSSAETSASVVTSSSVPSVSGDPVKP
jgi:hypothetical protein